MTRASLDTIVTELTRLYVQPGHVEQAVAERFGAAQRLIVYGSLVPGGVNHHELVELAGTWTPGSVTGECVQEGWGAHLGYPALRWDPAGPRVSAHLFESQALDDHWSRLDAFEGEGYRRVLVPFFREDGSWVVGQVYVDRS